MLGPCLLESLPFKYLREVETCKSTASRSMQSKSERSSDGPESGQSVIGVGYGVAE